MDNGMILAGTGLLFAIIGAIIGAISAQSIVQRRIQMENVTQHRKKWRKEIRDLVLKVHDVIMENEQSERRTQELQKYQNIFRTQLNPYDPEDNEIIEVIGRACNHTENAKELAKEFGKRVSILLKHDWDRSKEEVKHPLLRCCEPKRLRLDQSEKHTRHKSWWRRCRCQERLQFCVILFSSFPVIILYIRLIAWLIEVIFCKCWPLSIMSGWCS